MNSIQLFNRIHFLDVLNIGRMFKHFSGFFWGCALVFGCGIFCAMLIYTVCGYREYKEKILNPDRTLKTSMKALIIMTTIDILFTLFAVLYFILYSDRVTY